MSLLTSLLAAALVLVPVQTATPTPDPVTPPSVVQLCAATSVEQVDALLDAVAESQLVGALAPLLDITVPQGQGVKLDVDLDRFRTSLNCGPGTTGTPTPTPTVPPTATVDPTVPPTATPDPDDDDDDFGQVGTVPRGAAQTGDGTLAG